MPQGSNGGSASVSNLGNLIFVTLQPFTRPIPFLPLTIQSSARLVSCSGGILSPSLSLTACLTFFFSCRFGFHNTSAIDSLLDKDDVSLEAILDEDDLLQECKSQNTRLIDYFQRVDVLKRLLGYVTGEIEGAEERGRYKCVFAFLSSVVQV